MADIVSRIPPAADQSERASVLGRTQIDRPRVLSLCCTYPNPLNPGLGLFVRRRLQHLAKLVSLQLVSPFAVVRYLPESGKLIRFCHRTYPVLRCDGRIPVLQPLWIYPPNGGIFTTVWLFLRLIAPLFRLRQGFSFELIDTHFGYPDGIAGSFLSWFFRVPYTMTLRGNEPKHCRSWLARRTMRWALRRAARVFTVSERLREFAIAMGAEPEKVKTIPNGVDETVFHWRDKKACRLKHGFAIDRPLIVSAGALVERKGHHRVVAALRHLGREAGAQLAIAGGAGPEGHYEKIIRQTVAECGMEEAVRFCGPVSAEALAEIMAAADVFCLASTNEGWPNVVHEALACGTPVVATDVGAVPELLDGGRYGVLVPVNDQAALEKALRNALARNWNRQAISKWGCARSWDQVAQEVAQEMRRVTEEWNMNFCPDRVRSEI